MDPNAALAEIRALIGIARVGAAASYDLELTSVVAELADAVEALDGWLASGGFRPDAWTAGAPYVVVMTELGVTGPMSGVVGPWVEKADAIAWYHSNAEVLPPAATTVSVQAVSVPFTLEQALRAVAEPDPDGGA